jgi:uncharacterized membrane protein YadS
MSKSGIRLKEDWWAILIGLGIVGVASALFLKVAHCAGWRCCPRAGKSSQVSADLAANAPRYLAQCAFWLVAFGGALRALGYRLRDVVPAFVLLYLAAYAIFVIGQWDKAVSYNLEPPLIALFAGLLIANTVGLPRRFDAGFRGELYVKTGIVLLGATVPLTLIALAGPGNCSGLACFGGHVSGDLLCRCGLGPRQTLCRDPGRGRGRVRRVGRHCGGGRGGRQEEDTSITISAVVLWAIAMIFILPLAAKGLLLPTGIAGAWIGTSEFADAAGIAAAQAYGGYAGKVAGIAGTSEQALQAFTLMKVVGRDVWIGIWAVVLAVVATTRWAQDDATGAAPDLREIWRRFPKFVLGFVAASVIVSALTAHFSLADYNKVAVVKLIGPIKDLRSWAFIFCFFSIGLTTRLRELASTGRRPLAAFSIGVAVNIVLGYVLSVHVFGAHWAALGQ